MNNLTLKQLRYFEALARHGHFGRAAEACSISQPALSLQIKELEGALGAALFERGARQVRLTGLGEAFAARVREILRSVDELADLTRRHAGLDIHVRETLTPRLLRELSDGRLDTAIVALPISEPAFAEVPLFSEEFVLVRRAEDAGRPKPDAEGLRAMRLLLLEEGHCFRDQALSFCNLPSSPPRELLDGSSLSTLVQMVGAGIGVTLIPEMAVPVETRSASVSLARFPDPQPSRTIGMIWRTSSPLAPELGRIAEIVRGSAGKTYSRKDGAGADVAPAG